MSWFTPFFALKRPPRGPGRSPRFPAPFDALSRLFRALRCALLLIPAQRRPRA